jgi:hypothetical protein
MDLNAIDRKGLVRESYRIEGITVGECRTIFLDWAINLPSGHDNLEAIEFLLETYRDMPDDHPMTSVLREGLADKPDAKRRGGRKARVLK